MLDYYLIFRLVRRMSSPFKEWDAYKTGVIDDQGNIIVKAVNRTPNQNRSFDKIDLMSLKLRKLLTKFNFPLNPVSSYAAALWLLREGLDNNGSELLSESVEVASDTFELYIEGALALSEEAPATCTTTTMGGPNPDIGPMLGKKKKKEIDHERKIN